MSKHYFNAKNEFPTTMPPCTLDFRLDVGVQAAGTATLATIPKGSVVYGFRAVVTETVTSAGAATVQLGFTGKTMLSAATAKATLVEGYVLGPDESADAAVYVLGDSDTFDSIVATATLTAGKFDVTIFYHPPRSEAFDSSFKEWVTA